MSTSNTDPIKVGVITDLSGPLSFMGIANANVADMVVSDLNANGGLLGDQLRLIVEDSATDDARAEAAATAMVDEHDVDVVLGGIYSSTRQAIKGPVVERGRKLYIYPEQYEGQECDPLIFCTGPVPAQQVEPLIPWLMERTGAKTFYLPSADYVWPHVLNHKVREVVTGLGGSIVGEEYYPLDHLDYDATVERIMASGADVVFNTIVPAGAHTVPREPARRRLHRSEEGRSCAPTSTRTSSTWCRPSTSRGSTAASTTTARSTTRSASALVPEYERRYPGSAQFTAGSACTGMYRGLQAVGRGSQRGRLPRHRSRGEGARHCQPCLGSWRSCRDGPRAAPPPAEHVHRPGTRRCVRGGRAPRRGRPPGGRRREPVTSTAATSRPAGRWPNVAIARTPRLVACEPPDKAERSWTTYPSSTTRWACSGRSSAASTTRLADAPTNCAPWTVRRLASHALNNQLLWAGLVTGQQLVTTEVAMGAVAIDGDLGPSRPR